MNRMACHRARPHCRFVLPLTRFTLDSLTYSVPLFLKRRCGRAPGDPLAREPAEQRRRGAAAAHLPVGLPEGRARPHCRFLPPLIRFMPDLLAYSVPLFLKRQRGRTPPEGRRHPGLEHLDLPRPRQPQVCHQTHSTILYYHSRYCMFARLGVVRDDPPRQPQPRARSAVSRCTTAHPATLSQIY